MKEIKSVLFRIIFNLPLGFLVLKILGDMTPHLCLNQINMKSIFYSAHVDTLPSWFLAMIYLSLLLLAGEIVSILGEWLINWLFEFPAFWNKKETKPDDNFEKIKPCGETYISHKMLVTALKSDGGVGDFSELHFALSRLLAGAAWLCLLALVCFHVWWLGLLLVIVIAVIVRLLRKSLKRYCISCILLFLSILFIVILAFAKYYNSFDSALTQWPVWYEISSFDLIYSILIAMLAVILLFASCIYRSVANVINYSRTMGVRYCH
ncbi:MAG: hypothetical protein NTX75_02855 [Proteobacteria bacterium]|nr:hypothetical protein [Pseudomonadota bacterium]